jgi:hypothetical protein
MMVQAMISLAGDRAARQSRREHPLRGSLREEATKLVDAASCVYTVWRSLGTLPESNDDGPVSHP